MDEPGRNSYVTRNLSMSLSGRQGNSKESRLTNRKISLTSFICCNFIGTIKSKHRQHRYSEITSNQLFLSFLSMHKTVHSLNLWTLTLPSNYLIFIHAWSLCPKTSKPIFFTEHPRLDLCQEPRSNFAVSFLRFFSSTSAANPLWFACEFTVVYPMVGSWLPIKSMVRFFSPKNLYLYSYTQMMGFLKS